MSSFMNQSFGFRQRQIDCYCWSSRDIAPYSGLGIPCWIVEVSLATDVLWSAMSWSFDGKGSSDLLLLTLILNGCPSWLWPSLTGRLNHRNSSHLTGHSLIKHISATVKLRGSNLWRTIKCFDCSRRYDGPDGALLSRPQELP